MALWFVMIVLIIGSAYRPAWSQDEWLRQIARMESQRDEAEHVLRNARASLTDLDDASRLLEKVRKNVETMLSTGTLSQRTRAMELRSSSLILLAVAQSRQGNRSAALDALEALPAQGALYASWKATIEHEPLLRALLNDPRCQRLMNRLQALRARTEGTAFVRTSAPDLAQRIAGLSLFWSEAKYNFAWWDHVPDLNWDRVYLDNLPRVMAASTLHDYYDVLMRVAPLLCDGHTNIYPPEALMDEFYAAPPVRTELVENRVLITELRSPRARSYGLHVGDEIVAVDGIESRRYAEERVAPYVSASTPQDRTVRMYGYQFLKGDHRRPVRLRVRNAIGQEREFTLSRENDPGVQPRPAFEWRHLDGGIEFLAVNEFEDDKGVKALEESQQRLQAAHGLIIDLRNNGGGSSTSGMQLLSCLTDRPVPVERSLVRVYVPTFRAWQGPYDWWDTLPDETYHGPHAQVFGGPVVLLIGPRTFSAAEDCAVSFKAMNRGIVMGEPSGGSTGQPLVFKLPGGGTARICSKRDVGPYGNEFVGHGIAPDVVVTATVADVQAGRDGVVIRAVQVLRDLR